MYNTIWQELNKYAAPLPKARVSPLRQRVLQRQRNPQSVKPLSENKIIIDENGKPVIPKEYFNESGKAIDPNKLKQDLVQAQKQHAINIKNNNEYIKNKSEAISSAVSGAKNIILKENISNAAKKGKIIFLGICSLCILFGAANSIKKVTSGDKKEIVEYLPKENKTDLLLLLNNYKEKNPESAKKCDKIIKVVTILKSGIDVNNKQEAEKYVKLVKFFEQYALTFMQESKDAKLNQELVYFISTIEDIRMASNA